MMNPAELRSEAAHLADLAHVLVRINRDDTGERTEKPAQDLGHATIRLSIALDDLVSSGDAISEAMERGPDRTARAGDELLMERAELALLSAVFAGDFALDAFAWAELVRRKSPPDRGKDGKVGFLWLTLMHALDADPADRMTAQARYLDVTLDAARDALGAHRDPELWSIPIGGSGGYYRLNLVTTDEDRLGRALECLARIELPPVYAPFLVGRDRQSAYSDTVDMMVAASVILGEGSRKDLREAYRWGGFESPSLAVIASRFGQLVQLYLDRRGVVPGPRG